MYFCHKVALRQQKSVNLCDALIVLYDFLFCNVMCQKFVFVNVSVFTK